MDDLVRTELDLAQWYKQAVDGGKLEGKLYGLPFKLHPSFCVIYYNVNAVRELGQALPDANTTWEQTLDLGRRLKKTDGGTVSRWGLLAPSPARRAVLVHLGPLLGGRPLLPGTARKPS